MPINKPMRLEDMPQFIVESIEGTSLFGRLSTTEGIQNGDSYLLMPEEIAIPGALTSIDARDSSSCFRMADTTNADLVGKSLPLLGAYWSPTLIWQVLNHEKAQLTEEFQRSRLEECEICFANLELHHTAYKGGERFFCVPCFKRFVEPRDLSFVLK